MSDTVTPTRRRPPKRRRLHVDGLEEERSRESRIKEERQEQERTTRKKIIFLEEFEEKKGNISVACKAAGISRTTYYAWYRDDPDFKESCLSVREARKDWIESSLDKLISEGDTAATIFAAKTIARDRGYVEQRLLTGADGGAIQHETTVTIKEIQNEMPAESVMGIMQTIVEESHRRQEEVTIQE